MTRLETKALKPGDRLQLTIEKGVYNGLGLARYQGQVVLVPRAFRGDQGRVVVQSVTRGFARGTLEELAVPAPERRTAPCPIFESCGGCTYQELSYPEQLVLKAAILSETLQRGGVGFPGEVALTGSPERGWRTRAALHFRSRDGRLTLGFYRAGSHEVVDVESCLQLSTPMNQAARSLLESLKGRPKLWPALRRLELAESGDGGELVALIDADLEPGQLPGLASLASGVPNLSGFGAEIGGKGRRFVWLRGEPFVHSTVQGMRMRSHVTSFFQANRFLVEDLVSAVTALVPTDRAVLDLFAGVGLFTLPLARQAPRVLGVEASGTAVADARANAEAARIANVRLVQGDVGERLAAGPRETGESVVLDPPRTGAGVSVVEAVAARRPETVVYVSCDPPTLARDLAAFHRLGYSIDALQAFDLFPDTAHLETVVRLRPR